MAHDPGSKALAPRQPGDTLFQPDAVAQNIKRTLQTNAPTPFAMTFQDDKTGTVTPYVRKSGLELRLHQVARLKGGILCVIPRCVKSDFEDPDKLWAIYKVLPADAQTKFMETRDNDARCFTTPLGTALYTCRVQFKNGESYRGEGLANKLSVKTEKMHPRMNELAETRAFLRTLRRILADGFAQDDVYGDLDALAEEMVAAEEVALADAGDRFRPAAGDGAGGAGPVAGDGGRRAGPAGGTGQTAGGGGAAPGAGGGQADGDLPGEPGGPATRLPADDEAELIAEAMRKQGYSDAAISRFLSTPRSHEDWANYVGLANSVIDAAGAEQ